MNMLRRFLCLLLGHRESSGERRVGERLWLYNYCERCEHILAMKVL